MKNHRENNSYRSYERQQTAKRRKRQILIWIVLALVVLLGTGSFLYTYSQKQNRKSVTAGNTDDQRDGYRTMTYEGKTYRYNNLITTILYAGIDSTDKMEATAQYSNKARADSISLVVMDKKKHKMSIVGISRDTMTPVRRYTLNGTDQGTYETHIGYAYSYGDGGTVSCENLLEAVQTLIGEVPINQYVVTNQTSMPYINDLVGGVTVTVPNNDLISMYPNLTQGSMVTIGDDMINDYLRYRDTTKDFSNEGRIERQKSYVTAYIEKAKSVLEQDSKGTWKKIEEMNDYLQTNITKNKYLDLTNLFLGLDYNESDFLSLPGEDALGELHDEFYVDQKALQQMIVDLFYEEI